jgi:hypothetical protein
MSLLLVQFPKRCVLKFLRKVAELLKGSSEEKS